MIKTEIYFQIYDLPFSDKGELTEFFSRIAKKENVRFIDFEPHINVFKVITNNEVTEEDLTRITTNFNISLLNNGFTIESVTFTEVQPKRIIDITSGKPVSLWESYQLKRNTLYIMQSDFIGYWFLFN